MSRTVVAFALTLPLVGCGGSAVENKVPIAKTAGIVTYKGSPVADATVTFLPQTGKSGTAVTGPDGKFAVSTMGDGDGAGVGSHKVTVVKAGIPMPDSSDTAVIEKWQAEQAKAPTIPAKYANPTSSTLSADVKEGQENYFTFDLTD